MNQNKETAQGAANTTGGGVEQNERTVSASDYNKETEDLQA